MAAKTVFRLVQVLTVLAALLALNTCGGSKQSSAISHQLSDRSDEPQAAEETESQSLDETLAELEGMECPEGVDEALWVGLKDGLASQLESRLSSRDSSNVGSQLENRDSMFGDKIVATPPTGEANRVDDLAIADNGDGMFTLTWHYMNLGDYDQDGVVGISDIAPLAQHYGEEVPYDDTERNSLQAVIDGSGNGVVDIADITPIATHFTEEMHHYEVEGTSSFDESWEWLQDVGLEEGTGSARLSYRTEVTGDSYLWFRVVTVDAEGERAASTAITWLHAVPAPPLVTGVYPTLLLAGSKVEFSATVEGTLFFDYGWEFGDAATPSESCGRKPKVTIGPVGLYVCQLRVTNDYGSHVFTFTVTVSADCGDWQMEGRDAQHTSCSPFVGPEQPSLKWMLEVGNPLGGGVCEGTFSGAGTFYTQFYDDSLYAISPDGEIEWSHEVGYLYPVVPAVGFDGTIYAIEKMGTKTVLSAFNPDGSMKWSYQPFLWGIFASPTIGSGGTIYAAIGASGYSRIHALTPDGILLWTCDLEGGNPTCPALASDGTIYVGTYLYGDEKAGFLHAVKANGRLMWSFSVNDIVSSNVAVGEDGTIYFGSGDDNHTFYALNPDGSLKWSFGMEGGAFAGPAIGPDGTIYVESKDKKLHAIAPDGSEKWQYDTTGWLHSNIIVDAEGSVYFGGSRIRALFPDGTLKWDFRPEYYISSSALSIDSTGTLFALMTLYTGEGDNYSRLYAFAGGEQCPLSVTSINPQHGFAGKAIQFSFGYSGSTPTEYIWDFGGGAEPNTVEEQNPIITLGAAGEYEASLTIGNQYDEDVFPFTLTVREVPHEPWVHTWGTELDEYASALAVDCFGRMWVFGPRRLLIYDSTGRLLLANSWEQDVGRPLQPEGVVIDQAGSAYVPVSGTGVDGTLLLKYDQDGSMLWNRTWLGSLDSTYGITLDDSGNIHVVGRTRIGSTDWSTGADVLLLKYAPDGNLISANALRAENTQKTSAVALHPDGHLLVVGEEIGWGYHRPIVASFDSYGEFLWGRYYEKDTELSSVAVDSAGYVYAAGCWEASEPEGILLMKLSGEGDVVWSKLLYSPTCTYRAHDIAIDNAGDICIAGSASAKSLLFLKLNVDGQALRGWAWQPMYPQDEEASASLLCFDGPDVYIAGRSPDANGIWYSLGVFTLSLTEDTTPFAGTIEEVEGDEGSLEFRERPLTGLIDEGGGRSDFLLLKNCPP